MEAVRHWSVRHAKAFSAVYDRFERAMVFLDPFWRRLGYERVEKPVASIERVIKGLLFDCRMCGECTLRSTGMACPMNCPKGLRNGPCGGVRRAGFCEVKPSMRCVWIEAWEGARRMDGGLAIQQIQPPLDRSLSGRSAWLRRAREMARAAPADLVSEP